MIISATDSQLIANYLDGDKAAFDILTARYLKLVYSVALQMVKQPEDAEDVTQDVFLKVLKNLKRFDLEKPFKPWVLQITRHQALDVLKKKRPLAVSNLETAEGENLLDLVPDPQPLPDALVQELQDATRLSAVVKELTPTEQRDLFYRYARGFSFKEIGEEVHELLDTVKSRHRRTIAKLRKKLADRTKTDPGRV